MKRKQKAALKKKARKIGLLAVFALNTLVIAMIVVPHFGPIIAHPFEELRSYLATNDIGRAEQELQRLRPSYASENELQRLEAEILRRKGKDQLLEGDVRAAAASIARSRSIDFPEIRAALAARNWSRAAGLYALLSQEEKSDPAGRLLLAELRIGQGEDAYQAKQLFKAREFYREAFRLWPGHPLVYRRYHELMALNVADLRPPEIPRQTSPAPAPAARPEKEPVLQVIVVQGETRTIFHAASAPAMAAPALSKGQLSVFEGGVLGLLGLINLQLLFLWRRKATL